MDSRKDASLTTVEPQRITIGMTGASGAIYGIRLLEMLKSIEAVETHLIVSAVGKATIAHETNFTYREVRNLADHVHSERDLGATISSGSYLTSGMIIAPCSIKTLAGIAMSMDSNLIVRAADVVMKERRRLVLMVRETPLHAGHIRLMQLAIESGAIISPPVPAFYTKPESVDDIVNHSCQRTLDLFGLHDVSTRRWSGLAAPS